MPFYFFLELIHAVKSLVIFDFFRITIYLRPFPPLLSFLNHQFIQNNFFSVFRIQTGNGIAWQETGAASGPLNANTKSGQYT